MSELVGVRFKRAGKVYYFNPQGIGLEVNDYVVVSTARGSELGKVAISPKQVLASEISEELQPVLRKAEPEDIARAEEFKLKEQETLKRCKEVVARFRLPMKLLSAEYNLDGTRLTFFFTAEQRVDFSGLVRELASTFKTRVELRQVGPRDDAKIVGGFGRCGLPLCCTSFLSDFAPVSIRMAKEQDLPLNPMKISGICGRLLCCLGYENEQYRIMKDKLPRVGQQVFTSLGKARVIGGNLLKETVLVELDNQAIVELPLSEAITKEPLQERRRRRKKK